MTQNKHPKIKTRAQVIVEQAKSANIERQSMDLLEKAKSWGLQIKELNQAVQWIETQLSKQQAYRTSSGKLTSRVTTTGRVRKLKEEFLKVEDQSRQFRPLVKELASWPTIAFSAPLGSSPFEGLVASRTKARLSSGSSQPQRQLKKNKTGAPKTTTKHSYCEACDILYTSLSVHLQGSRHKTFATQKGNYDGVDKLIGQGKSLSDYAAEVAKKQDKKGSPKKSRSGFSSSVEGETLKKKPRRRNRRKSSSGTSSGCSSSFSTTTSSTSKTSSRRSSKKTRPVKRISSSRYSVLGCTRKRRKHAAKKAKTSPNLRKKRRKATKASTVRINVRRRLP